MPRNDQKPIEEADLWDILDWDVVAALSLPASSDPKEDPLAYFAKQLVEGDDQEAMAAFHKGCMRVIRGTTDPKRRNEAADLGELLGANPKRFIDYVGYKWGYFKKRGRAARR
jgi:hypothetical protein